jgi:ABC-type Fe3+ transport system permease subunit
MKRGAAESMEAGMRHQEGIRRIVIVIRAVGALIVALGIVGIGNQPPGAALFPIIVMTAILATPFFVVAWIIDGFVSREQKELDAMLAQWRRNYEMGRRALDRHPEA